MLIRVLGPLEIHAGGRWERVRAPKWRSLLARLVVDAGATVSVDALIEELWPVRPPRGATNLLHGYVSRLRTALGDGGRDVLLTRAPGYELDLPAHGLDAAEFESLGERGDVLLGEGRHDEAAAVLAQALDLWRAPAYADVPMTERVQLEADRLAELRLHVHEARLDADLARGRPAGELVSELQTAVEEQPLRERFWEQLMLALYRAGRQGDALLAYRKVHDILDTELGIEPGEGLTSLHTRILAADTTLAPVAGAVRIPSPRRDDAGSEPDPAPHQLPPAPYDFTGRTEEIARLRHWYDEALATGALPAVLAVTGGGGLGKTALLLRFAHDVAADFPDGQLHASLHGFSTESAADPAAVLGRLLRSLGVAAGAIPANVEEAAGLFRTVLAGRRSLIVLDDARDAEQVLPLLPGAGGSVVLVSSRDPLAGLLTRGIARRLALGPLRSGEARSLLVGIVGAERARAEPGAVAELVELCAGLPLATRIAAANVASDLGAPLAEHVHELGAEPLGGLDLIGGAATGDPVTSVRATFEMSFRRLDEGEAEAFELLGIAPADDLEEDAVAETVGLGHRPAHRLLERLCGLGLLDRTGRHRYAMHDLVRSYARERAAALSTDVRQAALHRLAAWHLVAAEARLAEGDPQGALLEARTSEDLSTRLRADDELARSLIASSWALTALGGFEQAEEAAVQAALLAAANGCVEAAGDADAARALVAWRRGERAEAHRRAADAWEHYRRGGLVPARRAAQALAELGITPGR